MVNGNNEILVVEDDEDLLSLITKKLTVEGFKVMAAATGQQALDYLAKQKPALVLLDMLLPGMNGLELLKLKNADPNIAAIPVIVISNLGSKEEVDEATKLGVKDYIVKANFSPKDIVEKAGSILGGK